MRRRDIARIDDVQRKLKRDVLIRPTAVEDRDRRAERLEVQKIERIFEPVENVLHGIFRLEISGIAKPAGQVRLGRTARRMRQTRP